MATPTLLSVAKADLITASKNVDSKNKHIKHQSAYFTQQAIEKTLKYLISLKNTDGNIPWGHDIAKLVMEAEQLGIEVPITIVENASVYTYWEVVTRYYPTKVIRKDTIQKAIDETKSWHRMLAKQGIK